MCSPRKRRGGVSAVAPCRELLTPHSRRVREESRPVCADSGHGSRCLYSLDVQRYLSGLSQRLKPISTHQHFRTLKTFFTWCVEVGLLQAHPMRGLSMQLPKTLPAVPEDGHVRRLLQACPDTFEGRRNRALIALLADSGLRISEALRLRTEDVNFATRPVMVRGGKGAKDGVGFFGSEAAQYLRAWLTKRRNPRPEDYLFVDRSGRSLRRDHATHTLHKLSVLPCCRPSPTTLAPA